MQRRPHYDLQTALHLLAAFIGIAVTCRAFLHVSTPYAPGMNGAYYLVQARAILEHGSLGIPDLPLTFHLHALLAWLIQHLSPLGQSDAILWSVRFCDSVLPPLTAIPIFLLFRRWAARTGRSDVIPLIAAGLSILAFPLFTMVGDFQKNSLGLLWLACLLNTLHAMLDQPGRGTGFRFVLSVLLLGLTHIGVLGTAIVTAGAILLAYAALNFATLRQGRLLWIIAGLFVLAGASGVVLLKYDPARIQKLVTAIKNLDGSTREESDPRLNQRPGQPNPGTPAADNPPGNFRPAGQTDFRPDGQPGNFRPNDGGPGAPGGPNGPRGNLSPWMRYLPTATFIGPALLALFFCWYRRRELAPADLAVVIGTALALIAITGPWVDMDKVQRLNLIAIIPASVVAGFALLCLPVAWLRNGLGIVALGWFAGNAAPIIDRGGRPILSPDAMTELRSLADKGLFEPEKTLIVTRHGAEWWTAWFLRTRIAQPRAVQPSDWQKYDKVLYLAFTAGIQEPNMMGGGPRPPGNANFNAPGGFRPDPNAPNQPGNQRPNRNRRGPGGMGGPNIPADAKTLHQGKFLTLAQVETPPKETVRR